MNPTKVRLYWYMLVTCLLADTAVQLPPRHLTSLSSSCLVVVTPLTNVR